MLKDLSTKYYQNGYNCAEAMLYAGNEYYKLGLDKKALKAMAGFGGGVAVEDLCGVISGAVAVLGVLFVEEKAHDNDNIKELTKEFVETFRKRNGSTNCKELKDLYRTEQNKCTYVVEVGAEILEEIISRYQK